MSDFETIIDLGSKNLRLGVFDETSKKIYYSEEIIIDSLENSLSILIKDAEKNLSTHIENVVVLYDSPKFYSLDLSIKKVFDHNTSLKKVYDSLIEEAHFIISQNNFRDQIVHLVINNIVIDENKKLTKITDDIKIKSLILEIKFICLNKILLRDISNKFKINNLKILNLYCSSYVKSSYLKKRFDNKDYIIFLDIGFQKTSGLIFKNLKFEFFKSINLGGNNITKDISKVLKLSLNYSEDLKIIFNKHENDLPFKKNDFNDKNLYTEILEKNISTNILKQIIEARIDEIIELVVSQNNIINKLSSITKPKLVMIGGGSKLLSNNYNLNINKFISELIIVDENDSYICNAGRDYHKSEESFLIKTKKKSEKLGFFENFFNFFSK
tara:strand:- start:692 stop:1843 length:1152 start_codon:yes stop_codon:yes gene_type:complete